MAKFNTILLWMSQELSATWYCFLFVMMMYADRLVSKGCYTTLTPTVYYNHHLSFWWGIMAAEKMRWLWLKPYCLLPVYCIPQVVLQASAKTVNGLTYSACLQHWGIDQMHWKVQTLASNEDNIPLIIRNGLPQSQSHKHMAKMCC